MADSSKVIIGQTAEASQYNLLRKDMLYAGYYPIDSLDNDDSLSIESVIVGDFAAAQFKPGETSIGYFDVQIPPQIDTGYDWSIRASFDMDTAEAAKNVRLELQFSSVANGGDTTPSKTTQLETVSVPSTAETLKTVILSTLKIPQASLASGNEVTFRLSRLGGDAADTHGGFLRLLGLQLIQTQT